MSVDDRRGYTGLGDEATFVEIARSVPLIGETIQTGPDTYLERPSKEILDLLMSVDQRIKYFPIDTEIAKELVAPHNVFLSGIGDGLSQQINNDFPDQEILLRGITAPLRDSSLLVPPWFTYSDQDDRSYPADTLLTVLRKGREGTSNDSPRAAKKSLGKVPAVPVLEYMEQHTTHALRLNTNPPERDNFFPIVIVYTQNAYRNWATTPQDKRIAAVYITDRVRREYSGQPYRRTGKQ